jgi:hypothetical protein
LDLRRAPLLLGSADQEHRKLEAQEATVTQLKAADTKQEAIIAQQQKEFQSAMAQQQKEVEAHGKPPEGAPAGEASEGSRPVITAP